MEWEGKQKPYLTKLLSYLVKNDMEKYYPWTWVSFVNQKNKKNKELKFVNENYISIVPKLLFFITTHLYTVYLFSEYADN